MEENIRRNKEREVTAEDFIITPEIAKKLDAWLEEDDRFTAEEIRELSLDSDTLFTEEELVNIIESETEREILDMDSKLIDACLWALENGLYKSEGAEVT